MSNSKNSIALIAPFPPPTGGMSLQAEKLYEKIRASGIRVVRIQSNAVFPEIISWLENLRGIRTVIRFTLFLWNLLRIKSVAVVQILGASHVYFFLVVAPSILMARLMGKKVLLNYRGGEAEAFLDRWGFIAVPLLKKADVLAVPSDFLRDIFTKATGREIHILPNLLDIDIFTFRERIALQPNIIVSRQLETRYNVACVLKAYDIIKKHYANAHLYIAGSGDEEKRLKTMCAEMSLRDVTFLGLLSHEELSGIYNRCDIMVNASNIDNFPGSILEAFASGIPVVSTEAGGIPYMVEDGKTGLLVKLNDHEGIAQTVIRLLKDSSLAQQLSRNGRYEAEKHSWEKVGNTLMDLYGFRDDPVHDV